LKLLGVETSSTVFSVAVCDGGKILSSLKFEGVGRPSSHLMELIQQAMASAELELKDLDGFTVSIGPGSFTGLRVGVMTVKTLAWALKKPVLPVSSLEVIAQNLMLSPQPFCVFLDARKGKVYAALFRSDGTGRVERLSQDRLAPPEEIMKQLKSPTLLVGDGVDRYLGLLSSINGHPPEIAPSSAWIPTAEALCRIAASRWPAGVMDDPHRLVPEYLYSQESDITGW